MGHRLPVSLFLEWDDTDVLVEALARAAARLESLANAAKHGRKHDDKAKRMRELRAAIMAQRSGAVGTVGKTDQLRLAKPEVVRR